MTCDKQVRLVDAFKLDVDGSGKVVAPDGWETCQKADNTIGKASDGSLYLCGACYGEFQSRLMHKWNCDFSKPVIVEACVKVQRCDGVGGCGLFLGDGRRGELITLYPDRIMCGNSPQCHCLDTTDAFHVYRIEIENGRVNLSVDGSPVLSSVLKPQLCRDHIGFGGFGSPGAGWWEYFRIDYHPKTPIIGGTVTCDDLRLIHIDPSPLNFPFWQRFSDGTIWLTHSLGQHVQDESKRSLWSLDNGKTWSLPDFPIKTLETCELPDGSAVSLDCWDGEIKTRHTAVVDRWMSPTTRGESETIEIELPFPAGLLLHRSMIRLKDGSLLAVGYGQTESRSKYATFLLRSEGFDRNWEYLSCIPGDAPGTEGFCEPCLLELTNGDVLCLMRTGGSFGEWARAENCGPLMQAKSSDGGYSWSDPVAIAGYGVDPHAIRLSDGTLVASAGRPGVYLLVDFSGTGDRWQRMPVYEGPGSSYTSLAEVEPGKVLLVYDESAFCLDQGPGAFNRIVCMEMTVTRSSR